MDIHLFVSAVIQIFVSAHDELSKTDLSFQSHDNIFAKISSSEIEELFEKHIVQHLTMLKRGMKKLGDMIRFIRTMLRHLKPIRTKIQNQLI